MEWIHSLGRLQECKDEQGDCGSNSHITHRQMRKTDNYTHNFPSAMPEEKIPERDKMRPIT